MLIISKFKYFIIMIKYFWEEKLWLKKYWFYIF